MNNNNQDSIRNGLSVSVSLSDLYNPACPTCYVGTNVKHIANTSIAGIDHVTYNCSSCCNLFTKQQGGMRNFVDQLAGAAGVSSNQVSISLTNGTQQTLGGINNGSPLNLNTYSLEQKLEQQSNELKNISSAIYTLTSLISNIVNQNQSLMERLATDPLIGIREKVNKFNLE